jgi:hypothetical protein
MTGAGLIIFVSLALGNSKNPIEELE